MAKKYINVDEIVEDWIDVAADVHPIAHKAWADYRREAMRCHFVPKAYTVPSMFPPDHPANARDYAEAIQNIRKSIGWTNERAKLPDDARPYRA